MAVEEGRARAAIPLIGRRRGGRFCATFMFHFGVQI